MATPRVHETSLDAANKYTERAMEHLRDKGYDKLGFSLKVSTIPREGRWLDGAQVDMVLPEDFDAMIDAKNILDGYSFGQQGPQQYPETAEFIRYSKTVITFCSKRFGHGTKLPEIPVGEEPDIKMFSRLERAVKAYIAAREACPWAVGVPGAFRAQQTKCVLVSADKKTYVIIPYVSGAIATPVVLHVEEA